METKPAQKNKKIVTSSKGVSNGAGNTATLKSHNQSPRKVRLVTDLVKGKKVPAALMALEFLPRRAAWPVEKLIKSAAASAKAEGKDVNTLVVKQVIVESAGMMKKFMPRAMGRATPIRRRKSRVIVTLA